MTAAIAAQLRAQIPASTDPERLEREAAAAENADGLDIPWFLKRGTVGGERPDGLRAIINNNPEKTDGEGGS